MSPTAMPAAPVPAVSPPHSRELELSDLDAMVIGRSMPKPLYDPRDHTFLEYIYAEMHSDRFINLEPLALLQNSLSVIFNGK